MLHHWELACQPSAMLCALKKSSWTKLLKTCKGFLIPSYCLFSVPMQMLLSGSPLCIFKLLICPLSKKNNQQGSRERERKKLLYAIHKIPTAPQQLFRLSLPMPAASLNPPLAHSRWWTVEESKHMASPWWGIASHCFPVFAPLGHLWVGMDDDTPCMTVPLRVSTGDQHPAMLTQLVDCCIFKPKPSQPNGCCYLSLSSIVYRNVQPWDQSTIS